MKFRRKKIFEERWNPKAGAEFYEWVLYAAFLEAEGLKHEAAKEWQQLARERPDELLLQDQAGR